VPDRYRVREIAQQVGLSEATVDRAPLQRLAGRKYLVDVFMQAATVFECIPQAMEAALAALAPAVVRCRFQRNRVGAEDGGNPGQDRSPRVARGDRWVASTARRPSFRSMQIVRRERPVR
jgi:hypothetical protein